MIKTHGSHTTKNEGKMRPKVQGNFNSKGQRNQRHPTETDILENNQDVMNPPIYDGTFIQLKPNPNYKAAHMKYVLSNQHTQNGQKEQKDFYEAKRQKIQQKQCNVCLQKRPIDEFTVFTRRCGHNSCCNRCFNLHSAAKIKEKRNITCPTNICNSQLTKDSAGFDILTPKLREQYIKLLKQIHQTRFIECKIKNCSAKIDTHKTIIDKIQKNRFINCPQCKVVICFSCRHFLNQCICQDDEQISQQLKANFQLRECPHCKILVHKSKDCNHFQCLICGQNFCHYCSGPWISGHTCPQMRIQQPMNARISIQYSIRDFFQAYRSKLLSLSQPLNCLARSLLVFIKFLLVVIIFIYQIFINSSIRIFIVSPYQQICSDCQPAFCCSLCVLISQVLAELQNIIEIIDLNSFNYSNQSDSDRSMIHYNCLISQIQLFQNIFQISIIFQQLQQKRVQLLQ